MSTITVHRPDIGTKDVTAALREARTAWTSKAARLSFGSCRMWLGTSSTRSGPKACSAQGQQIAGPSRAAVQHDYRRRARLTQRVFSGRIFRAYFPAGCLLHTSIRSGGGHDARG
jgi:hypothetical protein